VELELMLSTSGASVIFSLADHIYALGCSLLTNLHRSQSVQTMLHRLQLDSLFARQQ
jgi:hypothetical protein